MKSFIIPGSLEEARELLRRLGGEGVPIAGGTAGVFLRGDENKTGVDITRLGLDGIRAEDGKFEIGATTPVADLRSHTATGWVLDQVAKRFVTQQVRNISTLGGNVVRVFAWADFPVALLALDAEFVVQNNEERVFTAGEFFSGQPARLFSPGDLLMAVRVPAVRNPAGFAYHKSTRVQADYSYCTVAAWVLMDGDVIQSARVAVGACVSMPKRLQGVERALVGKAPGEKSVADAVKVGWEGPVRRAYAGMGEDFVKHVTAVALRDTILAAVADAKGGPA